jgi:hypothetical protein
MISYDSGSSNSTFGLDCRTAAIQRQYRQRKQEFVLKSAKNFVGTMILHDKTCFRQNL